MDLKEYLTINVLEKYVADMIIDNVKDMEEIVIDNIHIRKTHKQNFKIYNVYTKKELFFNTLYDYNTEEMKKGNMYYEFVQSFCRIMRNRAGVDEDFVKEIMCKMILYSFRNKKDSLVNYIYEDDITEFIQQGITDGCEDLIYRSQFDSDIRDRYRDFEFNYEPWRVIVEEEDIVDLAIPDEEWREENNIQVGDNLNDDGLFINSSMENINRFKQYLDSNGELKAIEELAILFYLEHLVYPYQKDYINIIHYILDEELEEESDDEEMV